MYFKMGNGYSTTLVNEAAINALCLQCEGFINDLCRQVFAVDAAAFTALTSGKKGLLSETVSSFVGFYGAMVDASGYNSQREQENIMNTNWARFVHCIGLLESQDTVTFIK